MTDVGPPTGSFDGSGPTRSGAEGAGELFRAEEPAVDLPSGDTRIAGLESTELAGLVRAVLEVDGTVTRPEALFDSFIRLKAGRPDLGDDLLWRMAKQHVSLASTRGLDALPLDEAIAEFDPTTNRRFVERDGIPEGVFSQARGPVEWAVRCLISGKAIELARTGAVTRFSQAGIVRSLAICFVRDFRQRGREAAAERALEALQMAEADREFARPAAEQVTPG